MPSFTFAATAQAALWNGLTPLLYDIDRDTWMPSAGAEEAMIDAFGDEIAVVIPYATFGNNLDTKRYERLSQRRGLPVVFDAAASLGSLNEAGLGFGTGSRQPVIFSMHATKAFATSEGGLIYSTDLALIERLRAMTNFGFGEPRVATLLGLNAKLPEVSALLALAKLDGFSALADHRAALYSEYTSHLKGWTFQQRVGRRQCHTFVPVLLPQYATERRGEIMRNLAERGIGAATYFSPHLAEHPFFQTSCVSGNLEVTEELARRIVNLPLSDEITPVEIERVCQELIGACE